MKNPILALILIATIAHMRMVVSGSGSDEWTIITRFDPPWMQRDTLSIPASVRMFITAPTLGERMFWGGVGFNTSPLIDETANVNESGSWLDRNLLIGTTVTAEMSCPHGFEEHWIDPLVTLTEREPGARGGDRARREPVVGGDQGALPLIRFPAGDPAGVHGPRNTSSLLLGLIRHIFAFSS